MFEAGAQAGVRAGDRVTRAARLLSPGACRGVGGAGVVRALAQQAAVVVVDQRGEGVGERRPAVRAEVEEVADGVREVVGVERPFRRRPGRACPGVSASRPMRRAASWGPSPVDHMPVLAIVGQQARAALGGHYQQEVDLVSMFKDVAGGFVQQASVPAQVRHLVDRAIRTALGRTLGDCHCAAQRSCRTCPTRRPRRKHGTRAFGRRLPARRVSVP